MLRYEKLGEWENAYQSYQTKRLELLERREPALEPTLGCMRCLHALGEWEQLAELARESWAGAADGTTRETLAPLAAAATWNLGMWSEFEARPPPSPQPCTAPPPHARQPRSTEPQAAVM